VPTFGLSDLYESAVQGAPVGIPDGNYDVEVVDVRTRAESRLLFVEYRVLNGPAENKTFQANLYIPDGPNANGAFYFRKKVKGFLNQKVQAAFQLADSAGSLEDALDIIADAMPGTRLNVNVSLRKEGEYKGTNELQSSEPLEGAVQAPTQAAPVASAAAPAPAAEAAPAAAEPAAVPF